MASKSVRVDEEVYRLALQYGKNLSEAISTMHRLIEEYRNLDKKLARQIDKVVRETIREELEMLRRY